MGESRYALIIANDSYEDAGLRKLRAPAHDAVALARVLGNPRIGGFDVEVVRNKPAHVISMHIDDFFSDRRPGDTLVLHFSCHGIKSESGELYFAARNTLPRRLASTAVPASLVRRCMSSTRARSVVLFLDCCYGGAFSQGAAARDSGNVNVLESFVGEKLGGGRGWAVITASNSMEYAFEGTELAEGSDARPSLFTHAVVQGLDTGEADLDQDGRVSLDELYEYVFDHVRQQNPNQTPSRSVDMQGDMYLAHSNRRRIRPSRVPDEVRDAMCSPDIYTRRGAIAELRSRMESPDLSIALGAWEALRDMARRDIRSVAEEARRAVSEVGIDPRPTRVDFGPVAQHSPPPHRSVRLLGPPLARSCVPHPEGDWLRAEESGDGLDLHVDTSEPGHRSGDIVLKGAVGEAVLHVEADVQPQEEHDGDRADRADRAGRSSPSRTPAATAAPPAPPPPASGTARTTVRPRPVPRETPHPPPPPERPAAAREPQATRSTGWRPFPAHDGRATPLPRTATPGRPAVPPAGEDRAVRGERSERHALALAVAGLVLAAVSAITAVLVAVTTATVVRGIVRDRGAVADHIGDSDLLLFLGISLPTAVGALVLCVLARHRSGPRTDRSPAQRPTTTHIVTSAAKSLAVPALILVVLVGIACLVMNGHEFR